jgi:glyoxylase-like metal-dependent hydrolase (beta-lactamase superfamily II)/rhodanese-related sulfurtransferase
VLFRQFVDDDLGCASYLVGCEVAGEAVVVDPAYAIEQYLEEAAHRNVRVVGVLETHTHADHVSGHGRFALEHGVPAAVHPLAEPEYPFEPLADGQGIEVGNVSLRVIHTPGHRPEHCCFAGADRTRADEPWLLLTGDSLFVGDAARPDLAVEAHEGAEGLFRSLQRLLELADGVEVYPGHVAGSLCGKSMSSKASTTIGFERRFNPALALATVEAFVRESTSVSAPKPPNIARIVELNRGPFIGPPASVSELDQAAGAPVLDVRPFERFAAGHVDGAVSVPVSGHSFATKAGFVLPISPLPAVHATTREEAERAIRGLRSVGFLELAGFVLDPVAAATVTLAPVELEELEGLLAAGSVELVDVREEDERFDSPLPGSHHLPYRLAAGANGLPRDRALVTVCESGGRAAVAASILAAHGLDARPLLHAGIPELMARRPAMEKMSQIRHEDVSHA